MDEQLTTNFQEKQLKVAKGIVAKYVAPDSTLYASFVSMVLDAMGAGLEIAREILNAKASKPQEK